LKFTQRSKRRLYRLGLTTIGHARPTRNTAIRTASPHSTSRSESVEDAVPSRPLAAHENLPASVCRPVSGRDGRRLRRPVLHKADLVARHPVGRLADKLRLSVYLGCGDATRCAPGSVCWPNGRDRQRRSRGAHPEG
jgi:hypothetical protein